MLGKEVYKIWALDGKRWSDWVRPVPFIGIGKDSLSQEFIDYEIPRINYIDDLDDNMAIIIDIDGVDSIKEGIALAQKGYRPIPIFNGVNPQEFTKATTNNKVIEEMLVWGAIELKKLEINDNAVPVFLLDVNRLNRYKENRGIFDNSWDVYSQDLPSYKYLLNNNINKVLVRSEKINTDLNKILYKYQSGGIKILFTDGYSEIKEVKIKRPKTMDI